MRTTLILGALLIAHGAFGLDVARAEQAGTTRVELQRHDLSIPGHEALQLRVSFDPGAKFPMHRHPGEEIIYVLDGALEYEVEGRAPVTLKAGDVLFVPAGVAHSANNVGNVVAAELGTFVVDKSKPLVTFVKE